jgi:hypothetical protein
MQTNLFNLKKLKLSALSVSLHQVYTDAMRNIGCLQSSLHSPSSFNLNKDLFKHSLALTQSLHSHRLPFQIIKIDTKQFVIETQWIHHTLAIVFHFMIHGLD